MMYLHTNVGVVGVLVIEEAVVGFLVVLEGVHAVLDVEASEEDVVVELLGYAGCCGGGVPWEGELAEGEGVLFELLEGVVSPDVVDAVAAEGRGDDEVLCEDVVEESVVFFHGDPVSALLQEEVGDEGGFF